MKTTSWHTCQGCDPIGRPKTYNSHLLLSSLHGWQICLQCRPNWPQMGQIRDFPYPSSLHFGARIWKISDLSFLRSIQPTLGTVMTPLRRWTKVLMSDVVFRAAASGLRWIYAVLCDSDSVRLARIPTCNMLQLHRSSLCVLIRLFSRFNDRSTKTWTRSTYSSRYSSDY